jgi:putative glutamine amidotransferase
MSKRPNIGVTGPNKGGIAAWWFTRFALFLHGGRAIRIRPQDGIPDEEIHGLIIGGGADINPQRYGGTEIEDLFSKDKKVSGVRQFLVRLATIFFFPFIYLIRKLFSTSSPAVDNERDKLEFEVLSQALDKGIPVLGICRGAQLMNIHLGGTLYNDIRNFYTEVPRVTSVWPKKKVEIDDQSKLFDILGHRHVWVNALHHQAVDTLGNGLEVAAREENGIVQAIEHHEKDFVVGVQWHPEYLPQIPLQRRIFKTLVNHAEKFMDKEKPRQETKSHRG